MAFAPGLPSGRRALITGGGTGLGRSIGRRFLALGASLAICGRREEVLRAAAEAFRAEMPGARVTTHPCDIRMIAIAPGTFPTEAAVARLRPAGVEHGGVPLRRAGRHEELADLAAFLVSDHAGYITGACVVADGGRRLLGGARAGAEEMLGWSDAQWAAQRARTPPR